MTGLAEELTCAPSDGALMRAVARGNQDALSEIFARHSRLVYGLAARICGHDRADDVVQDVSVQLWHDPERYNSDRGTLRTFLHMQAHGRAVDSLRTDTARRAREAKDAPRDGRIGTDIETGAFQRLVGDAVTRLLTILPEDERRAIVLAYFGGHTYRQVAEMIDQPEGTTKSRIRSGLRRLRAHLAEASSQTSILLGDA